MSRTSLKNKDKRSSIMNQEAPQEPLPASKPNLMLRLASYTYLSLPLTDCFNQSSSESLIGEAIFAENQPQDLQPGEDCLFTASHSNRQVCLVDWRAARVVRQRHAQQLPDSVSDESEKFQVFSKNLLESSNSIQSILTSINNNNTSSISEQFEIRKILPPSTLASSASAASTAAAVELNGTDIAGDQLINSHSFFKSTYFTVSPILATLAILINIFIILIVIFNTKQKRSPLIRANTTGQNNSLLFQLTVAGLLLAGYVLIEDISIRTYHSYDVTIMPRVSILTTFTSRDGRILELTKREQQQQLTSRNYSRTTTDGLTSMMGDETHGVPALLIESCVDSCKPNGSSKWFISIDQMEYKNLKTVQLFLPERGRRRRRRRQSDAASDHGVRYTNINCDVFINDEAPRYKESFSLPTMMRTVAAVYIWTVAALAYDRYYAIAHPLQYLRSFHNSRTPTFLTSTWIGAILLTYVVPMLLDYKWFRSSNQIDEEHTTKAPIIMSSSQFWNDANSSEAANHILESLLQQLLTIWTPMSSKNTNRNGSSGDRSEGLSFVELGSKLTQLAINLGLNQDRLTAEHQSMKGRQSGGIRSAIVVVLSLITLVAVIIIPLTIISICNISIYRIVKVHERRLSVSSGSNVAASSTNISNHRGQTRWPQREQTRDDGSDVLSVTSLLLRRFLRSTLFMTSKPENFSSMADVDVAMDQASNNHHPLQLNNNHHQDDHHDCERLLAADGEDVEAGTAARSMGHKRIIVRQDSQQILTKLHTDPATRRELSNGCNAGRSMSPVNQYRDPTMHGSGSNAAANAAAEMYPRRQRNRLKRKTSDHTIASNFRRSSFTSQPGDHFFDHYNHADSQAICSSNNSKNDSGKSDSGLISQLKLAGLSFAGIAVQEPSFNYSGRLLDKSTSCSLSNLHNGHYHTAACIQHRAKSVSRCSVESSPTAMAPATTTTAAGYSKKSYVAQAARHQQDCFAPRCSNKLLDNCSDDLLEHSSASYHNHHNHNQHGHHHHHNRLSSTIGTKSAAFNAIIWLVIALMLAVLVHYSLAVFVFIKRVNSASEDVQSRVDNLLSALFALLNGSNLESNMGFASIIEEGERARSDASFRSFLLFGSIWLTFGCRILFLSMLVLNGWLYGIRSRFLRTKMRMVLKKYISRRQASIEINHRNRSTASIRSRDSSFMSVPHHLFNSSSIQTTHNNSTTCILCLESSASCRNLTYRHQPQAHSTKWPRHEQDQGQKSSILPASIVTSIKDKAPPLPSPSLTASMSKQQVDQNLDATTTARLNQANNSIRFMIGDCSFDKDPDDCSLIATQTAPTSVTSSLNASCRSLISSSIHSSQSAAFLLIDPKPISLDQDAQSSTKTLTQENCDSLAENPVNKQTSQQAHYNKLTKRHQTAEQADVGPFDLPGGAFEQAKSALSPPPPTTTTTTMTSKNDLGANKRSLKSETGLSLDESSLKLVGQESRLVRVSSGEFRIYVTPADHELALDVGTRKVSDKREQSETNQASPAALAPNELVKNSNFRQKVDSADSWCKDLKQNLTKLLASTLGGNLSLGKLYGHHQSNQQQHRNSGAKNLEQAREPASGAAAAASKSRRRACPLIRSQSDDRETLAGRSCVGVPENSVGCSMATSIRRDHHYHLHHHGGMMRNSLTMSNIGGGGGSERQAAGITSNCRHHLTKELALDASLDSISDQPTSSQLKPPSFLKLIFDPNNNGAAAYSGTSALSPIKEYSSNHSYASSQSSLNNQVVVVAAPGHQPVAAAAAATAVADTQQI